MAFCLKTKTKTQLLFCPQEPRPYGSGPPWQSSTGSRNHSGCSVDVVFTGCIQCKRTKPKIPQQCRPACWCLPNPKKVPRIDINNEIHSLLPNFLNLVSLSYSPFRHPFSPRARHPGRLTPACVQSAQLLSGHRNWAGEREAAAMIVRPPPNDDTRKPQARSLLPPCGGFPKARDPRAPYATQKLLAPLADNNSMGKGGGQQGPGLVRGTARLVRLTRWEQ